MSDAQSDPAPGNGDPPGGGATPTASAPASARPGRAAAPSSSDARGAKLSRGRRLLVNGLIGVATLLLIVGVFSVWSNRLLFSPDNWGKTSTQLLQNPTIRSATANYAVDQLYANVDVAGFLKSALPPRLEPLAGPAAGALQNVAVQGVNLALTRPRVQDLWGRANRAAAKSFLAVVEGGKGSVGVKQGVVTLDLSSIVDNVASRLGLPPNLGAKLPPHIAHLTVLKSDQLKVVQNGGNFVRHLALWLTVLVPVMYGLAILLARGRRRRTLMAVGFAGIFGGLVVIVGRSIFVNQVTGSLVKEASLVPAVHEVVAIMTQMLHQVAAACIFGGIPLVIAAWLGGPARPAYAARRTIAPFLRERPISAYAITLGLMALIFVWDPIHATGTPAGIITFTLLALFGMFVLRRETAREFPDAQLGDATRRARARMDTWRHHREQRYETVGTPGANGSATLVDQLRELSDLRAHGEITPDEYDVAKAQLLHG